MCKNNWIPVSEALPDDEQDVLTTDGVHVELQEYKAMEWWHYAGSMYVTTPTHWMPLPEPPALEPPAKEG